METARPLLSWLKMLFFRKDMNRGFLCGSFGIALVLAWAKASAMIFYASALASIVGMMRLRIYAAEVKPVL